MDILEHTTCNLRQLVKTIIPTPVGILHAFMSSVVRLLGQALIHGYIVLLMANTGINKLAQEQRIHLD